MKRILFVTLAMVALQARSQLLINLQLPPNGVVQKSQLWNMTVTNTGSTSLLLHIELMLTEANSSLEVLSGATQVVTIPPGATQLTNANLQPIQYNVLSAAYNIDASPNGLLPVGDFNVCYSFMTHPSDYVEKIAEECQELVIEPLSPPLLVFPYDQSVVETKNPQLSWLPPLPVNLFINLQYDLDLVEVMPNQAPSDAIQQNVPLLHQTGINGTMLLYPVSAAPLEVEKQYAWRIIAKSNEMMVGQSETWTFSLKEYSPVDSIPAGELPYAKLKKDGGVGYAIFVNELKFDYFNETGDTTWNFRLHDLSAPGKGMVDLSMDSIPLRAGQNLVKYDVSNHPDFIDRHLYLIEVFNSRNESWRLKFEFRKPED